MSSTKSIAIFFVLLALAPAASAWDLVHADVPRRSLQATDQSGSQALTGVYNSWIAAAAGYGPGGVTESYARAPYCIAVFFDAWNIGQNGRVSIVWGDGTRSETELSAWQTWTECHEFAPSLVPYPITTTITAWGSRTFRVVFNDDYPGDLVQLPGDVVASQVCERLRPQGDFVYRECRNFAAEYCDLPGVDVPLQDCYMIREDVAKYVDDLTGAAGNAGNNVVNLARGEVNRWSWLTGVRV